MKSGKKLSLVAVIISLSVFGLFVALNQPVSQPVTEDTDAAVSDTAHEETVIPAEMPEPQTLPKEFPFLISKSFTYENLQIFFLKTDKNVISKRYITLSEAMDKKLITVFETGNVNELAVENTSDQYVFICSGEIVKGGKQDRTIGKDIILPPRSGKIPLASFCVESGRWHRRNEEKVEEFKTSNYILPSRELRMAAKNNGSQNEVWDKVSRQQNKVNESMIANYDYEESFDVRSEESASSLQLTLENKELVKVRSGYENYFKGLNEPDGLTVGFVYAVNGEIYGIDIYNNYRLFRDLWPKLLDALIVEAISERDRQINRSIKPADILSMVTEFSSAKKNPEKEEINSETTYVITVSGKIVKFETFDKREKDKVLHINYIISANNIQRQTSGTPAYRDHYQLRESEIE